MADVRARRLISRPCLVKSFSFSYGWCRSFRHLSVCPWPGTQARTGLDGWRREHQHALGALVVVRGMATRSLAARPGAGWSWDGGLHASWCAPGSAGGVWLGGHGFWGCPGAGRAAGGNPLGVTGRESPETRITPSARKGVLVRTGGESPRARSRPCLRILFLSRQAGNAMMAWSAARSLRGRRRPQ